MKRKLVLLSMIAILTNVSFGEEIGKSEKIVACQLEKNEIKDCRKIINKWQEFLIGLPNSDSQIKMTDEEIKKVVSFNEKNADGYYSDINLSKDRKSIFKSFENMKSGVDVLKQYDGLVKIVKAYATPGTKYYKKEEIKTQVIDALDWLYDNAYHENLPELGNWWQWEIGIPKKLNEILAIMYDEVPKDKKIKYLKASQYFQPYAKWSAFSPSASYSSAPHKRISTGGNRIDTSLICFIRGVLMEDRTQILDGLNSVAEVGKIVTEKDGFYKDGSFVQHDNVAYNGTYATVLFDGLGMILELIDGTEFKIESPEINNIYDSILKGYSYLMINGGVNDSVSGRSISRDNSSEIERGRDLVSSITLLSSKAPKEYRNDLYSMIKKIVLDNNFYSVIKKESKPKIKNILENIIADENIKPLKVEGTKIFGAMDRAVYTNSKEGKVVLSMHSNRIANYETMNEENLKGWYTGDGMTYIYGKDSSSFVEFWPTADMYHLSGVTNSINKMENKAGERREKPTVSPKKFVGGVETGDVAFVGMDFISWNNKTTAKKSWLMIDGAVLALGSNITSTDGEIHTTIDNRILKKGKIYIDGKELNKNSTIKDPKNLTINFNENYPDENIGYKIINSPELNINFTENKGSWKDIGGTLDTEIVKQYFSVYLNYGKDPKDETYAYVILPMFSKDEVENYDTSRFKIEKLDDKAHIVRDAKTDIVAINFWNNGENEFEGIKTKYPLSIIKDEEDGILKLYVSDPTQAKNENVSLEISGKYKLIEKSSDKIFVKTENGVTKLNIDLKNNGSTEKIELKKIK
ncbi:polysaccharide lyase 8 family protein [uncultured Fusobacterium sp.]|uniref:polysaccharide lyase 8 family protein n=1 Tax=uncultured Fusobacterium sp. TaxID=159267 RepID=UPI0015A667B8|nr:polysaccharide lyase 8 family protein [uncultured Fusobacterium sp.]